MANIQVTFIYLTGIRSALFRNPRLSGSWDSNGNYSGDWTSVPMEVITGEDGCPAFTVTVPLSNADPAVTFNWGVVLDCPETPNSWGIASEVNDPDNDNCFISFQLAASTIEQVQRYYLTNKRRLGANKYFNGKDKDPKLIFRCWAPHAEKVEVVFSQSGYIAIDGTGIDPNAPVIGMNVLDPSTGIWESSPNIRFVDYTGKLYMFRITFENNPAPLYRTDIFARELIGRGNIDPQNGGWDGTIQTLDGTVGCAVVVDPDQISADFPLPANAQPHMVDADDFWKDEFDPKRPLPVSIDDLVIYELHVGALGNTPGVPGTLQDAVNLLPYLADLGINAIELLPMAEFFGTVNWGYGDTHHMVIQSAAGGRDEYRYFIRACHRLGIAVIQDVVYNHYDQNANRAEWQYDSVLPQENSYYWYEGIPSDYGDPNDGYLANGSSGWSPNFSQIVVRGQFAAAAAFLADEMHIDGFRADLTQAIYHDNQLYGPPNWPINAANNFGRKMLREWGRTLRLIKPGLMLMAEDYTGDSMVLTPAPMGGFGFDAIWFADFFHGLIGYQGNDPQLLLEEAFGDERQLAMSSFSGLLYDSQYGKVVYHSVHDDAGANITHRTVVAAVNGAPLIGNTMTYAKARSRVVFGISLLSAGTPLFFMGDEVAAQKPFTTDDFLNNREDLVAERAGSGAMMFRFYQDLLTLNHQHPSIRSKSIDILYADDSNRVIIFKRWYGLEQLLVVASMNNFAFPSFTLNTDAYRLPNGGYREVFNSDGSVYGGRNTGNGGATLPVNNGSLTFTIPANGLLVFIKVS